MPANVIDWFDLDAVTSRPTTRVDDTAPSVSVVVTVMENVPVCVGVPEITPVELLRVRPGGKDPVAIDQD